MRDPSVENLDEQYDSPLERLQLLGEDDAAIAVFLDEIDVRSPRERMMLGEMARAGPLAQPDRFEADHRRAVVALESLRRHGHHGTRAGKSLGGPLHSPVRFLVELVARYVVVSHVKNIAVNMRNLYWLREMQAVGGSCDLELLRPARMDAQALVVITGGREIGIPTFVLGGLLIPAAISLWRLASGFAYAEWWIAAPRGRRRRARRPRDLVARPSGRSTGKQADSTLDRRAARASLDDGRPRRVTAEGSLPDVRGRGHRVDARSVDRATARRHDLACWLTNPSTGKLTLDCTGGGRR